MVHGNVNLIEFAVCFRHVEHEAGVQAAGSNGYYLLQGTQRTQLQFGARMASAELPKRLWNHTMPGITFRESDSQSSGLSMCHTCSAYRRLIHLLKNPAGIFEEGLPRRADFHAP